MACDSVRIDSTDLNSSIVKTVGEVVTDPATGIVYFLWSESKVLGDSHNRVTKFRSYNPTTETFGTEVTVADTSSGTIVDQDETPKLLLTSDKRFIAIYGTANNSYSKESTDYGATWTAGTVIDATVTRVIWCACLDEATGLVAFAVLQQSSGGGGSGDLWAWKRTGVDTWTQIGLIHDAGGISTAPYFLGTHSGDAQVTTRQLFMATATEGCLLGDFVDTGPTYHIGVLYTTNGWTSAPTVNKIKTFTASLSRAPMLRYGTDGRLRVVWMDNATGSYLPTIAYSDTNGQAWTIVGTPTATIGEFNWDALGNRAYALGRENTWFMSSLDNENESGSYYHRIFSGGDTIANWEVRSCVLAFTAWSDATCGESFFNGRNFFRVFNKIVTAKYQVNFLEEEDVDVPGTSGPPLVEESPSGSDATNIVLRNRVGMRRGWSAHDWGFSCFAGWPEGDYTTQRRLPIKIAGASIIDPSVSDPASLPALFKFDDPEHYGRERFMLDASGNPVPRLDPFYAQAHTKAFALTDKFGVAVVRGVLVSYRRAGATLPVQIWIDGILSQTSILPETGAQGDISDVFPMKEIFIPIARLTNVGKVCQLRFEIEDLFPFVIEKVAIKKIPKRIRARNQS